MRSVELPADATIPTERGLIDGRGCLRDPPPRGVLLELPPLASSVLGFVRWQLLRQRQRQLEQGVAGQ